MPLSDNAVYLLKNRYCRDGEQPEDVFKRVAGFLSKDDSKFEEKLYNSMANGIFLPNSPALFNAGTSRGGLFACFCLSVEDNIDSIFKTVAHMAKIFKEGGGVGINFSSLREANAPLSGGGESSGAISFMGIFDNIVEVVKQAGLRRGALMGVLDQNHPEIFNFIKVKLERKLQNFNLSIMVTDDFMKKVETNKKIDLISPKNGKVGEVKAKDIFELMAFASWVNGDPALLFYDRINKDNPFYPEMPITCVNPCFSGETRIVTKNGFIPIKDLVGKKETIFDGDNWIEIDNFRVTGQNQKIIEIILHDGSSFKVTPYHKIYLENGERKEAKDIKIGDRLEFKDNIQVDGCIVEKGAYLKGFLVADGCKERSSEVCLMVYKPKYICLDKLLSSANEMSIDTKNTSVITTIGIRGDLEKDERVMIQGLTSRSKELLSWVTEFKDLFPKRVFCWDRKSKLEFLAGLFDGDGSVMNSKNGFGYQLSSISLSLLKDVQELLKTMGVYSKISLVRKKQKREIKGKIYDFKDWYRLTISQTYSLKLSKMIKFERLIDFNNKNVTYRIKFKYNKVVKIKEIGIEEKVYCCTIPTTHKILLGNGIITGQCSESALPNYAACCLGSINLSKFIWKNNFNFDKFADTCVLAMRTLTNINELSSYPLPEIKESMEKYNPVGVGVMGFADVLIKLGIYYDSRECLDFIEQLCRVYKEATESYNPDKFYLYRQIIAPTGSLSILADCSSGIEPIYDVAFERNLTIGRIEEVRDLYKSQYVRTAHQVSPEWHIKVVAKFQEFINGGISKTCNVPNDSSVDDIKNIYKLAWESGLKGVTIYRDGSRNQVLTSSSKTNKFEVPKPPAGKCSDESCIL